MVIKNLTQKSRFIPSWQKTIAFAFVIGSLAVSRMASGEACEGPFAGVNQMLGGIVIGGALGAVVGAFWPVRE